MSEASATTAPFPFPDTDWEPLRPFWEAAARGALAIPRCADCGAWCWYPCPACRDCGGSALSWTTVSGRGRLFSWAVVRRAWVRPFDAIAPYATGLVALDEAPGVRLVSLLVDCAPEALRPELPVQAVFRPLPFGAEREVVAPLFRPRQERSPDPAGR